jgi:hypothetical protein
MMWSPFFHPCFSAIFFPATKPLRVAFDSPLTAGSILASSMVFSK